MDANVWCGTWSPLASTRSKVEDLETERGRHGIARMFVSPLDALLNEIPDLANDELGNELEGNDRLEFVPVVNPTVPRWHEKVTEYAERCGTRWLRIAPSYHHYSLSREVMDSVASYIARTGFLLSLQMRMEDERNQNPILDLTRPPLEELSELAGLLSPRPLLIHNLTAPEIAAVAATQRSNILVDIAFAESFRTMAFLTDRLPAQQLVLGSNFPLFYLGAAIAKVTSWRGGNAMKELVFSGNICKALRDIPSSRAPVGE